ncbi:MAG: hypothetical protein QW394_02000, partial [Thermofilaceae archaeon]
MPWIGVSADISEDDVKRALENLGLILLREIGVVELETSRGWLKFRVFEVAGGVEDSARVLAEDLSAPAFESGPHLVLGEVSARLWDEGAKVVFPDGESEVVPIFTYDGFLDVRMPTRRVKGLKATIIIGGTQYELPLEIKDLLEVYAKGQKAIEKVEKAASVYGLEKVVSPAALEELRRRRAGEVSVEVDYEAGFVMVKEGVKVRVVSLDKFILDLIVRGELDKLRELVEKAPDEAKRRVHEMLRRELELAEASGDERRSKVLKEALEKLGFQA